ncbi:putative LOC100569746 [Trichonephila clavipes]|uniref:Putative LOC100569746 n=1 Tax=Trichonephila clavipes TaxID=2585209 RepID=A0A8X6WIQ0_TRICX|nr:putative LOC100569746 [Trichonephila clavipes]
MTAAHLDECSALNVLNCIVKSSSSCASATSSNAKELDEQILEVKINPQEKNTVSDTSTNKDTLSKEKESENENEETKLIRNDFAHYVVNGDRYRAMITNFFIPELNNHDVQELWFQQDGATCPTARATIDLLKDTFGDRLISRFGLVNWPPRSCDLTSLDYFLWGYVKSLVSADKPQTFDHLEDNIRRVIADIRPQMLEKVIENWTSRLDYIRASRGSHMLEIILKM